MATKTFKIGECCKGGIITVETKNATYGHSAQANREGADRDISLGVMPKGVCFMC